MHSAHATVSGLWTNENVNQFLRRKFVNKNVNCEVIKSVTIFFHISSQKSLKLERTEKSDNDSEPEVFFQFHDRPDIKQDRKTISREKAHINTPFSDSQITITSSYPKYREYKTHISSPESELSEEANFSDLGEYLIAADKADLEELEQLKTEIILARPQVLDLMNANLLPGQQDGQGAAAQPIAQQQHPQPAAAGAPIAPPAGQGPIPPAQQPLAAQAPPNAQMFFSGH